MTNGDKILKAWERVKQNQRETEKHFDELKRELQDAFEPEPQLVIDKRALREDLLEGFTNYQFRLENPFPTGDEDPDAVKLKYQTDAIFKSKVDSLVFGVMTILDKHI